MAFASKASMARPQPACPSRRCRVGIRRNSTVIKAIGIPDSYGYVLGSVATTALVNYYLAVKVSLARKQYNVPYPAMYAGDGTEDAVKFNCVQRSHQNMLEYLPTALTCQMLMGLKFPVTAAVLGLAWAVGRIVYATGYSTGDPKKRAPGSTLSGIVYLALIGGTFYAAFKLLAP